MWRYVKLQSFSKQSADFVQLTMNKQQNRLCFFYSRGMWTTKQKKNEIPLDLISYALDFLWSIV